MYTFIDKNYLIPSIINFENENAAISHFVESVNNKKCDFIKNISLIYKIENKLIKILTFDIKKNNFVEISSDNTKRFFEINNKSYLINEQTFYDNEINLNYLDNKNTNINLQQNITNKKDNKDIKIDEVIKEIIKDNNKDIEILSKADIYRKEAESFLSFESNIDVDKPKKVNFKSETKVENKVENKVESKSLINDDIIIINDDIDIEKYKNKKKCSRNNETNEIIILNESIINEDIVDDNIKNESFSEENVNDLDKKEMCKKMMLDLNDKFITLKKENKKSIEKIFNFNKKLEKLEKERKSVLVTNLRKLKDEYLQYKKLIYSDGNFNEMKNEEDIRVPHIFNKKYEFIKNACCSDNRIKSLFENILLIDVEELFYSLEIEAINKNIINLSESYNKLRKDLHVKFESDYNYLEDELTIQNNTI